MKSAITQSNNIKIEKDTITIPTFVDVHVHLREPGFFYKETMKTGTMAAAKSGYSHVFSMPNLKPVPDTYEHLKEQLDIIEKDAVIKVIPYGSITMGEKGGELSKMEEMAPYVCGFTDDGVGVESEELMEAAMVKAKELGKMIVAHCEDMALRNGGYIHDGEYAKRNGHLGICSESEWAPIARDVELIKKTGCSYHVCHVSSKESVEIIRQAKAAGVDITCETAPHYLVLTDEEILDEGRFKMNPPIRSAADRDALIEGLLDGTVDMIATDHAPHSAEEKSKGLKDSAMGITGLETAFPIIYTKLVKTGVLTLEKVVELMSTNPRKRFRLPEADPEKDYAVWEVATEYEINPEEFTSMGKATPFAGEKVYGKCLKTVVDGETVWSV
ncbi:MAG: dihydroorotase [Firmicutes bacterium]|nr:dihydroorotase [Bacillota bacterium]